MELAVLLAWERTNKKCHPVHQMMNLFIRLNCPLARKCEMSSSRIRNRPSGLVVFSLGRGGLRCLPITCLTLKGPDPGPAKSKGTAALAFSSLWAVLWVRPSRSPASGDAQIKPAACSPRRAARSSELGCLIYF